MSKKGLLSFGGHELRVECDYSPPTPDVMYLSNGDPGYPGDPEEFYVTKVELKHGAEWIDISLLCGDLAGDLAGDDPLSVAAYESLMAELGDREA